MKKIRSQKGASLAETLVTVLLLSLAFAAAATGISSASQVYRRVRVKAAAETLLSTSIQAVSNDLYYAAVNESTVANTTNVQFYNDSLHMYETISNASGTGVNHTYLQNQTDKSGETDPIVADETQSLGLYVQLGDGGIAYLGNGRFSFTMQVYNKDSSLVDQQYVVVRSAVMK